MQPYEGLTIVDLTYDLGRYATRLFADLGARVLRAEPLGGAKDRVAATQDDDPGAKYEFEFFNASKEAICLDLVTAQGLQALAELVPRADAVVVERGGPLYGDIDLLKEFFPNSVVASVSPFGRTGPLADAPASDLVLQAAGGIAWLSGKPEDAPLRLPGSQVTMITGVYLATVMSVALWDSQNGAAGHDIDISAQEAIAHSLQNSIQVYDFERRVSMRGGEGTRDATESVLACKDGHIFLAAPRALGVSWDSLLKWIAEVEHPALLELEHERWADRKWRLTREAKERFRETIEPFLANFTKAEITEQGLRRRIVLGPASTVRDVLQDPQLAHTAYFEQVRSGAFLTTDFILPGAPYRFSEPLWRVAAAPSIDSNVISAEENPV
ncbi:CoA transferase [Caballeronia sp. GaOx3]|uniref:CoA transferase n=1 Tax=Caballeronia sp. GaOx3 TaxID=2921740 RepID=UPI002027DD97|nr:CoA transferase [Caballeronia sp. GaOx3]